MLYDLLPQDRTSLERQLEIRDILRSVARAYGGYIWPDDDRLFMFSHPRGDLIESGVAEFDSAIKSRHYKKLTITAKKLSLRLRNIPIMKYSTSLRQVFVTISALSQAPSAWPTWTACEHSLAQPSDSRREDYSVRDIPPGSVRLSRGAASASCTACRRSC